MKKLGLDEMLAGCGYKKPIFMLPSRSLLMIE